MIIDYCPSPNFDDRTLPISLLVLHYTGMKNGALALERLCDPSAKVSAHYMVEEDGHIFELVYEDKRAWHAGVSEWRGESDINSASIGIEIVNGGHDYGLPPFPKAQIKAVIALSQDIMKRYNLCAKDVLAHSDIAPARKIDPGEMFPWPELAASGIGLWPDYKHGHDDDHSDQDKRILFATGARDTTIANVQRALAHIGYGARVSGVLDEDTGLIIAALQRRYRPELIDQQIDIQTMAIIGWLAERT